MGWFLQKGFVDLFRAPYVLVETIPALFVYKPAENKNLSKVKHCCMG